ncbi:serine/threonine-protein kinase CBK1-like protein [Corchorus olitorius]|uniref:Serine/threonine-protein kinase CBK1-like protein n=1 Tax=Corchorus olitorius TaxID=93759 RepID=A0A1R3HZT7_9ROSI|nr:serine/threonine-protein kinase CBK1-like protein [Corchorus olitorius]
MMHLEVLVQAKQWLLLLNSHQADRCEILIPLLERPFFAGQSLVSSFFGVLQQQFKEVAMFSTTKAHVDGEPDTQNFMEFDDVKYQHFHKG